MPLHDLHGTALAVRRDRVEAAPVEAEQRLDAGRATEIRLEGLVLFEPSVLVSIDG